MNYEKVQTTIPNTKETKRLREILPCQMREQPSWKKATSHEVKRWYIYQIQKNMFHPDYKDIEEFNIPGTWFVDYDSIVAKTTKKTYRVANKLTVSQEEAEFIISLCFKYKVLEKKGE